MTRWLRQHRYALMVAFRRLAIQPFSSLANILVIALTLAVPIIAAGILASAEPVARQISVSPEVTLFLADGTSAQDRRQMAERLQEEHTDQVRTVRIVPKDQALQTLKSNPSWSDALSVLPGNPLPDAIIVTLTDTGDLARRAGLLAEQWRNWDHVDTVQLDSDWVQRLDAILHFIRIGLALLGIGVAVVVLATVFNTVRLQALSQREEIAVARLVGATESFVRRPFLYLGALTGVVAALVAMGLAFLALYPLNSALHRLASSYGTQVTLTLPDPASLAMAAIVIAILGALAARWSVTRNTRF